MTVTSHVFAKADLSILSAGVNLSSDTLKCALGTGSLSAVQSTAQTAGDVYTGSFAELSTANGYTANGVSIGSPAVATTAAAAWATTWAAGTVYAVGTIIRKVSSNGYLYQCVVAGTSHASTEPTWTTVVGREQPSDNGVIWLCIGTAVTVLTSSTISWTSSGAGFSASYAVIYDSTSGSWGSSGTAKVISWLDFGGSLTASGGGTFQIMQGTSGLLAIPAS